MVYFAESEAEVMEAVALTTVRAYRDMAADAHKKLFLASDQTSLQFLVYVLEDTDPEVIHTSLETLNHLSQSSRCRPLLCATFGVTQALWTFARNYQQPEMLRRLSADIYRRLQEAPITAPFRERQDTSHESSLDKSDIRLNKSHGSRVKVISLHIRGLITQDDRRRVEEQLVRVRGVISIVFDMIRGRCICRTKSHLQPPILAAAIARVPGMEGRLVARGHDGQEVLLPLSVTLLSPQMDKENLSLPEYLPEEDSPVKDNALASHRRSREGGWLSSAVNFLHKSFYW